MYQGFVGETRFGSRMVGTGPYAEMIGASFRHACRRYGLQDADRHSNRMADLDTSLFKPPPAIGDQFNLFDQSNDN